MSLGAQNNPCCRQKRQGWCQRVLLAIPQPAKRKEWPTNVNDPIQSLRIKRRKCSRVHSAAEEGGSGKPISNTKSLTSILMRKRDQLQTVLSEYTEEALSERLQLEGAAPVAPNDLQHRFAGLIPKIKLQEGRPVLVAELGKSSPSETSTDLAELAKLYEAGGADGLAVPTDLYDTSTGLADLLAVCRAVKCPVVRRDWILHPLQILEAKEAGASGVMGIVTSIMGQRAALYSSYAAQFGLDCPVEIVNLEELTAMEKLGVPFFGMNAGVALSVGIPGFRTEVATGLLKNLPAGTSSMMGAATMKEVKQATLAGADIVLLKKELLASMLSEAPSSPTRESMELEVSQQVQKASGPLFGGPSGQSKQEADSLADRIAAMLGEIKYAVSGDD